MFDDGFRYFYPVKFIKQLTFEMKEFMRPVYKEGHISYLDGGLLCGAARDKLVSELKGENSKTLKYRLTNKAMCPVCLEKWKANPSSAWQRWVNGTPVKAPATPEMAKFQS